ncbi:diguanylate cyclase [candidate division KSB1 bacterium]|nr:MAG: diguanylate cyclase [candidate division KSB1 bacterium]
MPSLETTYMGLTLKNPILAASSGLTKTIENVKACEKAGVGAVVLKSLFEEVLAEDDWNTNNGVLQHPEMYDYLRSELRYQYGIDEYCTLIQKAKEETDIPIIASINGTSFKWLLKFARRTEAAGADALELNVYLPRINEMVTGGAIEAAYFDVLEKIKAGISIPVSMKIGMYFSSLPEFARQLEYRKLDALVMFNRFTEPEIDIENIDIHTTFSLSPKEDINRLLRWTAIVSAKTNLEISATGGVHSYEGLVKLLLAGASTVQLASVLYNKGLGEIETILEQTSAWMQRHSFEMIDQFRGILNFSEAENAELYLRAQFMEKIRAID